MISISATTVLKEYVTRISVRGNAQYIGSSSPYRVMHAGWIGFGYHAVSVDSTTVEELTYWRYVDLDVADYNLPIGLVFGDHIYYDIPTGTTVRVNVIW